jgi:hypothetical protein
MLLDQDNFSIGIPLVKNLEMFEKQTKLAILQSNYPLDGYSLEVMYQEGSLIKHSINKQKHF